MPRGRAKSSTPLERGHVKIRLIRELALGEKPTTQLGAEYGVTHQAISQFRTRHRAEIAAAVADIGNEFVGLWVARKAARLAEYQQDVEDINLRADTELREALEAYRLTPGDDEGEAERERRLQAVVDALAANPSWMRVKARILRQVAEEMGHLPARVQIQVNDQRVNYVIEGVDLDKL